MDEVEVDVDSYQSIIRYSIAGSESFWITNSGMVIVRNKRAREFLCRASAIFIFNVSIAYTLAMGYCLYQGRWLDLLIMTTLIALQYNLISKRNSGWVYRLVFLFCDHLDYFSKQAIVEHEKADLKRPVMYAFHPHSVLAFGILVFTNPNQFSRVQHRLQNAVVLCSRMMLLVPVLGFFLRAMGAETVNPASLHRLMKQGRDIALVPGGFEQATLTTPKELRLFIKSRKGFVKYAMRYDYQLVPVLVANQHKSHSTFDYLYNLRMLLNKVKLPGVFFLGKWMTVVPEWNTELFMLVGPAMDMTCKKPVTKKDVADKHEEYVARLVQLYERNKKLNQGSKLVIF